MIDRQTFSKTLPNYRLPVVSKALTGEDIDKHPRKFGASHTAVDNADKHPDIELSEQELQLASPVVYGFSLTEKLWCMSILIIFSCPEVTEYECSYSRAGC